MATGQKDNNGKKRTVEDAANALKNNKAGTDNKNTGDTANAGDGNQAEPQEGDTDDKNAGSSSDGINSGEPGADVNNTEEKANTGDTANAGITLQLPSPEAIENAANQLSNSPELLAAAETTVARAKEIIAIRNQPPAKTAEEVEAEYHARLVKIYGKDYVTASRNNSQGYFSRLTWNNMGKAKNGWKEVVKTMPEVAAAEAKK